jgi:hypothetical protein
MLAAAEAIAGDYVWGRYDLVVMPPSFPYGGMENPCLTFVTPTLLVGGHVCDISFNLQYSKHFVAAFSYSNNGTSKANLFSVYITI